MEKDHPEKGVRPVSDLYKEHLVKKEPTAKDRLVRFGSITLTVLFLAAGLLMHPLFLIPGVALGVVSYIFLIPNTDVEYEYLLVNHSLDVDKVMAKSKRKKLRSFDLSAADIIAPVNSHRMDYYNSNTNMKVLDFSSGNPEHKRFAFVIRDEGTATKVIIEPDEAMANSMRQSMPNKCFLE